MFTLDFEKAKSLSKITKDEIISFCIVLSDNSQKNVYLVTPSCFLDVCINILDYRLSLMEYCASVKLDYLYIFSICHVE